MRNYSVGPGDKAKEYVMGPGKGKRKGVAPKRSAGDYGNWQFVGEMMLVGQTFLKLVPVKGGDSAHFVLAIRNFVSDAGGVVTPRGLEENVGAWGMPGFRSKIRMAIGKDAVAKLQGDREITLVNGSAAEFRLSAMAGLEGKLLGYILNMYHPWIDRPLEGERMVQSITQMGIDSGEWRAEEAGFEVRNERGAGSSQ